MEQKIRSEFLLIKAEAFVNKYFKYDVRKIIFYKRRCYITSYDNTDHENYINFIEEMNTYDYTDLEIHEAIYLATKEEEDD